MSKLEYYTMVQAGRMGILQIDAESFTFHLLVPQQGQKYLQPKKLSRPKACWYNSSLCRLTDRYYFLTGGRTRGGYAGKKDTYRYDMELDVWSQLPDMPYGKLRHSSCAM